MDSRGGIRRKPSSTSLCPSTSSRVSQSCPSSPRHSKQMRNSPTSLSQLALPTTSSPIHENLTRTMSCNIRRSPSSSSTYVDRPKSGPSGARNNTAGNIGWFLFIKDLFDIKSFGIFLNNFYCRLRATVDSRLSSWHLKRRKYRKTIWLSSLFGRRWRLAKESWAIRIAAFSGLQVISPVAHRQSQKAASTVILVN